MSKFTYYRNLILAAVFVALGISISYVQLTQKNGGFPYKEELVSRHGYIDWVQEYDYGIRFAFVDDNYNFNYPSKSNGQSIVYDSLFNSKGKRVEILFEPRESTKPIYTTKEFHDVFEVKIEQNVIRSYAESEKAWKSDNLLMPFILVLFLIGGPYIWWKTKKEYKNA
ncbi:hypothetical protein GBO14_13620 [Pseudoalteromonas shioyasakiensis]|uniref:hypothetical protein n=1 Tax=Pseudoalteromonas shioyasakiensis TaxID=1190813 RepID=UPI0020958898|nr:hypothetical protein [Pseudoalteromonas shioyasakiensis]MCO6355755.1 hypothetical protein [Pseudoalteromonas shioyasakiensis]